jgi:hypothetical protein
MANTNFIDNQEHDECNRVCIVMTTFNGELYLEDQLRSIASQTLLPNEMIVSDDGSTDRTIEILKDFAKSAAFPVKINLNLIRLGFSENFFQTVRKSSSQLIAFCDQDDVWDLKKLEICCKSFDDPEILLCVHASRIWFGGQRFGILQPNITDRLIVEPGRYPLTSGKEPIMIGMSMVVRRSVFELADFSDRPSVHDRLKGLDYPMSHDEWVWMIAATFGRVLLLPNVLALYRKHSSNTSGVRQNFRERLVRAVTRFSDDSQFALDCAEHLIDQSQKNRLNMKERACRAAEIMQARARLLDLRASLYRHHLPSTRLRIAALAKFFLLGGYKQTSIDFSFGRKGLLQDLFLGVSGAISLVLKLVE